MPIPKAYLGEKLVSQYDAHHFGGAGGQYVFQKDIAILDRLLQIRSGLILDAPCGTGIYTDHFAQAGFNMVGADASFRMLQQTRSRGVQSGLFLCDVNQLPLQEQVFDAVLLIRLMQHLPRQQMRDILHEFGRVVKPGGKVIFDTLSWSPRAVPLDAGLGMHVYTLRQAEELIREAGLVKVDSVSAYLFSAIWYRKFPIWAIKIFERIEAILPAGMLLRTFWACTCRRG